MAEASLSKCCHSSTPHPMKSPVPGLQKLWHFSDGTVSLSEESIQQKPNGCKLIEKVNQINSKYSIQTDWSYFRS